MLLEGKRAELVQEGYGTLFADGATRCEPGYTDSIRLGGEGGGGGVERNNRALKKKKKQIFV